MFLLKLKLQNTSNKDTFHCISDELSLVYALISIIITSFQYLLSAAAYILENKLKKHKSFKQENLQQKLWIWSEPINHNMLEAVFDWMNCPLKQHFRYGKCSAKSILAKKQFLVKKDKNRDKIAVMGEHPSYFLVKIFRAFFSPANRHFLRTNMNPF